MLPEVTNLCSDYCTHFRYRFVYKCKSLLTPELYSSIYVTYPRHLFVCLKVSIGLYSTGVGSGGGQGGHVPPTIQSGGQR